MFYGTPNQDSDIVGRAPHNGRICYNNIKFVFNKFEVIYLISADKIKEKGEGA